MAKRKSILIIDDNESILQTLKILLHGLFTEIDTISSPIHLEEMMFRKTYHVVLLDMNFQSGVNNGNEGLYWLSRIKEKWTQTPVVLITAYADVDLAVEGMKRGASDFITKPWDNEKLVATLKLHADENKPKKNTKLTTPIEVQGMYWGESTKMTDLKQLVERVSLTDANILIVGENGTGKEVLAREIHRLSTRNKEAFITVDMGAIPDTLFESEMFGYQKGAFTDAKQNKQGKFELAHCGTLFMDEVGNMPVSQQVKLLSCLQSRQVVAVGGTTPISFDIRLVTATNANLKRQVEEGLFREDLFYRINTIFLEIPPLRERLDDLEGLVALFIEKYTKKYNVQQTSITAAAIRKLRGYSWPGNVRELQHEIEKAVIMSNGFPIDEDFFLFQNSMKEKVTDTSMNHTLEEMEQKMIEQALRDCEGNISSVAVRLGITRQTLYNKLKRYNL